MKVVIWGGTGFIGSHIIKHFLAQGDEVINVSRNVTTNNTIETLTYSQPGRIIEALKSADGAIFSAGIRLNQQFSEPEYLGNLTLLCEIVNLLKEAGQNNCVFLSSIGVYGNEDAPWKESSACHPQNLYALSKKHQDDLLSWINKHQKAQYKILRLAQVMGLGERKGYLFNTFFDQASHHHAVTLMGTGSGKRQYIYIKDVVRCIRLMMTFPSLNGIFNVGIEGSISIKDLAKLMHESLNVTQAIKRVAYPKEDVHTYEMDVSKIEKMAGFCPFYSVRDAILDIKRTTNRKES